MDFYELFSFVNYVRPVIFYATIAIADNLISLIKKASFWPGCLVLWVMVMVLVR